MKAADWFECKSSSPAAFKWKLVSKQKVHKREATKSTSDVYFEIMNDVNHAKFRMWRLSGFAVGGDKKLLNLVFSATLWAHNMGALTPGT